MTRIPCYDKEGNTIKSLTQWDKNQSVYIDDLENGSLPRVHFALGSNAKESKEYKDNVKFDGKKIKITIPNELLKTYAEMYLFLYYGDVESEEPLTTKYMVKIPITKKPQPDDYIYEDNVDYLSIYKLKLELSLILDNAANYAAESRANKESAETAAREAAGSAQEARNILSDVNSAGANQIQAIETAGAEQTNSAKAEIDAKGKQTLDSIPKDYTGLQTEVDGLKGDLSHLFKYSRNLLNLNALTPNTWVSNTSGNLQIYDGWTSTDYIPVDGLTSLFFLYINNGAYNAVGGNFGAYYDSNKNYISGFAGVQLGKEMPANAKYVRISNLSALFSESVKPIVSSLDMWSPKPTIPEEYEKFGDAYFDDSENILPNVYESIKQLEDRSYTIPNYYTEHVREKELKIRENFDKCGVDGDSFVFITDYHDTSNSGNSANLIRHIMDNSPVGFVCLNGDLINDRQTKDLGIQALIGVVKKFGFLPTDKFFVTIGNHEFNNASNNESYRSRQLSLNDVYSAVSKHSEAYIRDVDGLDFYVDNHAQKTRYYFIGSSIGSNPFSKANKWFAESLTTIHVGYKVIVFSHIGLNNSASDWETSMDKIVAMLEAYKAHTSYTLDGAVYDFSAKNGDVIAVFSGHMHLDGALYTTSGIPFIATTCDAFSEEYGTLTRTKDTITEQAFDVVQIDRANRKIYMTRIGAGSDREFTY